MSGNLFVNNLLMGNNNPSSGKCMFDSTDHMRFQNGQNVSGHNYGCNRRLVIEKNITGKDGYTVSILNMDAFSQQYQMSPKPMKIINVEGNTVELRGYGYDEKAVAMGVPVQMASFEDYGIAVMIENDEIVRFQLNIYDRNISIVYL